MGVKVHFNNDLPAKAFSSHFRELLGSRIVDGFTIQFVVSNVATAIADNIHGHAFTFNRIANTWKSRDAKKESLAAFETLKQRKQPEKQYLEYFDSRFDTFNCVISDVLRTSNVGDPFGVQAAIVELSNALRDGGSNAVAVAHLSALNRLDAFTTMVQKLQGDPSDILQTVRWEARLLGESRRFAKSRSVRSLLEQCVRLQRDLQRKRTASKLYPEFLKNQLSEWRTVSKEIGNSNLGTAADAIKRNIGSKSLAAMQKSHRAFVLELEHSMAMGIIKQNN